MWMNLYVASISLNSKGGHGLDFEKSNPNPV